MRGMVFLESPRTYARGLSYSKAPLAGQQVLNQRFVERNSRVQRDIVDVGSRRFFLHPVAEFGQAALVIFAHSLRVELKLLRAFDIYEFDQSLERELDFSLVEHVEQDDFVAAVPEVVERLEQQIRVGEQVA